jgi:hypothetical protein
MADADDPLSEVLRLCLDVNVFVADEIAKRGRSKRAREMFTSVWMRASRELINIVISGGCEAAAVQLVVSWDMLTDLENALTDLGISDASASTIADGIAGWAMVGPVVEPPHLVLGGTGVLPVSDQYRGTLETALAGHAHVLATESLGSFKSRGTEILAEERVAIYASPDRELVIAVPQEVAGWLRKGMFPIAESVRGLYPRTAPSPSGLR